MSDVFGYEFWPIIRGIVEQAQLTWQWDDDRLHYVDVQVDKEDIEVLRKAYSDE